MGFFNRIGNLLSTVTHRIGSINVNGALNRIGAVASAGHKLVSLANVVTGGAVRQGSNMLLGQKATDAIGKAGGYLASAYDTAVMTRAGMGTTSGQYNGGANTATVNFARNK